MHILEQVSQRGQVRDESFGLGSYAMPNGVELATHDPVKVTEQRVLHSEVVELDLS